MKSCLQWSELQHLQGATWQLTTPTIVPAPGTPPSKWLIETTIAVYTLPNGTKGLLQVFRDNTSFVWQSTSYDDGLTWTPAAPGTLPSPDSKVSTPRHRAHQCFITSLIRYASV